jgi:hypothetical protein
MLSIAKLTLRTARENHLAEGGFGLDFKLPEYALHQRLHLWSDKSRGSQALTDRMANSRTYLKHLEHWWHRVSQWPHGNRTER